MRNQRFNAKLIALRISPSFSPDKVVINDPMFDFETVCMWSQLTAQSFCMPSRRDKSTSLGMVRIVEVTGATVTSPKYSRMEFLVKIILAERKGLFTERENLTLLPMGIHIGKMGFNKQDKTIQRW